MSYDARQRRPLYAPPARTRSTLATYGPLILTVALATAGAVAWLWADSRSASSDDEDPHHPAAGPSNYRRDTAEPSSSGTRQGWTGSPAQLFHDARAALATGAAAVGSTLGLAGDASTDKGKRPARDEGFSDHERWNEEPAAPSRAAPKAAGRKTVAVVVSAETRSTGPYVLGTIASAGINHDVAELFVLIYAPDREARAYTALKKHAEALVPSQANVFVFETPSGYVHMLRHLAPGIAYVVDAETLAGKGGETVAALRGWVGQTVVIDQSAQDVAENEGKRPAWWESSEAIGPGKGVEVIGVETLERDWTQRVG